MVQRTARGSNRYLVELTAPEAGWKDVDRLIRRAREATGDARFVRAIFVPEDSSFLLLYEAALPQEALTAASELQLDVERVSEVLSVQYCEDFPDPRVHLTALKQARRTP